MESEDWKKYPHIVAWVDDMNKWADSYQIYEFIQADENGHDPTGRIESGLRDSPVATIEHSFVWTELLTSSEVITSEFHSGDWGSGGVNGWYLGRVSHENKNIVLDAGKFACSVCQGAVSYEDEDGEEADCDVCMEGDPEFIRLSDTGFRLLS